MMKKSHKVALITGASKGIGKGIALGFARLGYHTILTGRNEDDLKQVIEEIQTIGNNSADYYVFDINDSEKVKSTISDIVTRHGRIDVLVNNAGIFSKGTFELSEKDFKAIIETNLTSQFVVSKAVVPIMQNQKSGYIFNIGSRSSFIGHAHTGGYCSSKFGLLGLSESMYRELTPQGIKVTALCPAWVDTEMADRAGTPLDPSDRIQTDDLFKTIEWLLSLSSGACVKELLMTNPKSL